MSETMTERLVSALAEAREIIRSFHKTPAGWAEYQQSPEMKRINGALDDWTRTPIGDAVLPSRQEYHHCETCHQKTPHRFQLICQNHPLDHSSVVAQETETKP